MNTDKHKLYKFISIFLCGFVFLFVLISVGQPARAEGASFYLSPSEENYELGKTFSAIVFINTQGTAINAGQAKIYFPPEKLKVTNISKSGSIFTLWVQEPVFSNSKGEISFGGGLPSPGYRGEAGKIITIFFQGKSEGEAKVDFGREIITANDPWGTNVFSFSREGIFSILPPEELPPKIPVVDTEPPLLFEITIDNEGDSTNPNPLLYFETEDEISGMSHYEIKIGEEDFFKVALGETKPFRLPHLTPGIYQIIVRAFDKAGNYIDSLTDIKVESIAVPEITICPKTYNAGEEILYIGGMALPGHTVSVFLTTDDRIIKSWEVYSDEKGEWFLAEDGLFKPGIYKISARAKDVRGAISDFSGERSIRIFLRGLVIGPWIIDYKTLTLFAFIVLVIILFVAFYLFLKTKRTRKLIEKETQDLKQKFYKEYEELSKDIEKELEILRELRGKREITEEEKKREAELLKNLADVKEVFEKELKDVEKELK